MNYLFHIDDLSDDMDNTGTAGTADDIMTALYHPSMYSPKTRVGRMTSEYVLCQLLGEFILINLAAIGNA